ncbi:MAG: efflux transporter outer membrane subunit, partial [Candidatus Nucleicultricaceae bacterium]
TLSATSSFTRQQTSASSPQVAASTKPTNLYNMGLSSSWEIDLFDHIGKSVEVATASAEAERATLDGVRLSQQALLAQYYFQLKLCDLKDNALLNQKKAYTELLSIAKNKYASGIVGQQDLLQAQLQLETLEAQYYDNILARAQLENAMATLLGQAPSSLNQAKTNDVPKPPQLPYQIPSALLERRPDIRQAERLVAEANAQIGLEYTAYFPALTLSGTSGFQSRQFFDWFTIPARFWSLGPALAHTIFDGGARDAAIMEASHTYEQTVSTYKNTVLTAFQEVENFLAELRFLNNELQLQRQASLHARQALEIATNQYKAGTNSYSDVLIAQNAASSTELQSLDTLSRLLVSCVNYIKAIGGSWSTPQKKE